MVASLGDNEEGQPSPHLGEGIPGRHQPGEAQAASQKVWEAGSLHAMPPGYGPTNPPPPPPPSIPCEGVRIFSSVNAVLTPT